VDEHPVERRDTRLTTFVDRRERDVLRSLEVPHELVGVQAALGLDDPRQMRVRARVGASEQCIELVDLGVGLEHGVRPGR